MRCPVECVNHRQCLGHISAAVFEELNPWFRCGDEEEESVLLANCAGET